MGHRPNVIKFEKDLGRLHIDYEVNKNKQEYWIEVNSIEKLNLKEIEDKQLHYLAECLLEASDSPLAQRCGYVYINLAECLLEASSDTPKVSCVIYKIYLNIILFLTNLIKFK